MDVDTLKDIMLDSLKMAEEVGREWRGISASDPQMILAIAVPIFEARVRLGSSALEKAILGRA